MAFEVERKFRVADHQELRRRLERLGVRWEEPVEQVDRYFAHPQRDFARTDEALRLRRVGPTGRITYKGPKLDPTTKTRREIELPIGSGGEQTITEWTELLEALGFRPVAEVRKTRHAGHLRWQAAEVEVALDTLPPPLATFVELELPAQTESELEAAKQNLASLAEELGLTEDERRSYLEMLLEGGL